MARPLLEVPCAVVLALYVFVVLFSVLFIFGIAEIAAILALIFGAEPLAAVYAVALVPAFARLVLLDAFLAVAVVPVPVIAVGLYALAEPDRFPVPLVSRPI